MLGVLEGDIRHLLITVGRLNSF